MERQYGGMFFKVRKILAFVNHWMSLEEERESKQSSKEQEVPDPNRISVSPSRCWRKGNRDVLCCCGLQAKGEEPRGNEQLASLSLSYGLWD